MADISSITPNLINPTTQVGGVVKSENTTGVLGPSFKEALGQKLTPPLQSGEPAASLGVVKANALKFSSHAVDRMRSRGINYSPEQMSRIESAIDKAAGKGAKETLLLTDSSAMIVSVANRTVVTVMDKNALKENVFTNIDSTVVI
jgi:flagellar operon protein